MSSAAPGRRLACAACMRPQSACICRWVSPIGNAVEVVILQHPLEQHQAKGSARLLHLSLAHSWLAVGESFAEDALRTLLYAPLTAHAASAAAVMRQPLLLYPDTLQADKQQDDAQVLKPLSWPDSLLLQDPARCRLIVLDATWRKSRKMLYLNPLLQQLPRLALSGLPPSRYVIRKAHRPEQLSTLEATCHALMRLERDDKKFQPLLQAFDGFVAQQACYRRLD